MQYIVISFLLFFSLCSQAQDTAIIKTSAQCESCKSRLEDRIGKIKGVQSSHLNIDSKIFTVVYDPKLLTKSKIEDKVSEVGYDANTKPAKKAAYKRLPACCRKDYTGDHH